MTVKQRTKLAAVEALNVINSGGSVTQANSAFANIAGFGLSHSGKRDFCRLLAFYAEIK